MIKLFLPISLLLLFGCAQPENEVSETPVVVINEEQSETQDVTEIIANPLKDGSHYFSGAINRTYPFHMHLIVSNDAVTGWYYYDKHRKELKLKGKVVNGQLELDELYKDKVTGHFYSSVLANDSIGGDWKSPKGKQFPFAVTKSDYEAYDFTLNEAKRTWSDERFKAFVARFDVLELPNTFDPTEGKHEVDEALINGFNTDDVQTFLMPDYDPEIDFEYQYAYAGRYETEKYVALFYYETYYPGVFGIDNRHIVLRTYTPNGDLIDQRYLACDCLDRNYFDEYWIDEELTFDGTTLKVTGASGSNSNEWAEEEDMPVFDERKDVSYSFQITPNGKIK